MQTERPDRLFQIEKGRAGGAVERSHGCRRTSTPSAAPEQAEAAEKTAGAAAAPRAEASGTADSALGRYCTALVNLWGIAPAAMVAAVYNQFTGSSVTAEDVEAAASCPVVNGELIHKNLADRDDEIAALRKSRRITITISPLPTISTIIWMSATAKTPMNSSPCAILWCVLSI